MTKGIEQAPVESREMPLRARIDEGVRLLLTEMQQGKSERLLQYLAFTARLHQFSTQNQLLIYLQRPDATWVAGYRRWQELGYQVRKGERGIRILAPSPRERPNPQTGKLEEVTRFVVVSVFDASQLAHLDQKPLPVFFTPLADDQPALYARLKQIVESDGIQVGEETLQETQGFSQGRRITLRAGIDSRSGVLTLLHEYAHELLHWQGTERRQPLKVKECHAEAIAYVVGHHFDIHNPFSADYLQQWGNTTTDLRRELEVVQRTAAYIIQRLETSSIEPGSLGDSAAHSNSAAAPFENTAPL